MKIDIYVIQAGLLWLIILSWIIILIYFLGLLLATLLLWVDPTIHLLYIEYGIKSSSLTLVWLALLNMANHNIHNNK